MICRICGKDKQDGVPFDAWVKDTFTNWDSLYPGDILCRDCQFWFNQRSTELQRRMGKDKPQKMQNYSHFVTGGAWEPVSKGDKIRMTALLLDGFVPELAAIATSGQKHIAFRARRNPPGQSAGWVQFEESPVWVEQAGLRALLGTVETLYTTFSKGEIETGQYSPKRILDFGVERWHDLEQVVRPVRQTMLFQLALFLAQRSIEDGGIKGGGIEGTSSDAAKNHLAGDTRRLQESLPDDDLGSIRERNPVSMPHQQSGEIYQLDLFKTASEPGANGE
jgi:hypothetical protein